MENKLPDQGLKVKYLVDDICEAYQDGLAIWEARVKSSVIIASGDEENFHAAMYLGKSLEKGAKELGSAYRAFYMQAGSHFASGNIKTQTDLARCLNIIKGAIFDKIKNAPDDALAGIPILPGSYHRYTRITYGILCKKSDWVAKVSLKALSDLFTEISAWAVPLHTLPPIASPSTAISYSPTPENYWEPYEPFYKKLQVSFGRQRYVYEELPTSYSFRLVRMDSARPYVTCRMETFDLTNPPDFHALSYCWGTGGQDSNIWCNGKILKVSENLKKGMKRLYSFGAQRRVQWFWVDQICIDQKNFPERMQQVRLMRAIYQRAQNTVVWLGPDNGYARDAFSLVNHLYQASRTSEWKHSQLLTQGPLPVETNEQLPPEADPRWKSLSSLLELPWFERCWIIQEIVVSPGDPVLLFGQHDTLWSQFQRGMEWLGNNGSQAVPLGRERLRLINGIFELMAASNDVWELQSLLLLTRPFQATDKRDKVFALLGMAGESRRPDHWPQALMPNYNRETKDVYTEVTLHCIQNTKSLDILSQAGLSETKDEANDYPSWVPRWDLPYSVNSLSAYTTIQTTRNCKLLVAKFNNASNGQPACLDTSTSRDILRLGGVRISTVEACLPIATYAEQPSPNPHPELLKTILNLYRTCQVHLNHLSSEDLLNTFAQVTTAGLTAKQNDVKDDPTHSSLARSLLLSAVPKHPEEHAHHMSMTSLRNALRKNLSTATLATPSMSPSLSTENLPSPSSPPPQPHSNPSPSPSLHRWSSSDSHDSTRAMHSSDRDLKADALRYIAALSPLLHRRLFVTSEKRLGLGPAAMMSGDVVAVLWGGNVPFVLRRVKREVGGEAWRLVGECYLDGIMGGAGYLGREEEYEWFDLV